ncbi:MAG TPA: class I SAM-dependent methyltransferase, partial [Candidatus Dormibacteraeota bacterium]
MYGLGLRRLRLDAEEMPSTFSFTEHVVACDLCGAVRLSTVSSAANVVECAACGYRFVNPRPSQAEIANSYSEPDFYDGWITDDSGRQRMWSKRLGLVKRAGPAVRLLDVGAGIGTFLALARDQLGWDVVGTEVSTSAVKFAQEHYGLDLVLGPIEELQLRPQSFDLITLW